MNYDKQKTLVADDLRNLVTSMNAGTDRLQKSHFASTNYFSYQELSAMYMSWLGRRICDLVPGEALKKGWKIICPSWDNEKIRNLTAYCESVLELKEKLLECFKAERWSGGALMVAIINEDWGGFQTPVPSFLPKNSLLGIQPFDAWQCAPGVLNWQNPVAKNFRLPETYSIAAAGMSVANGRQNTLSPAGTMVHWSRVERFEGLYLPWYERQRNLYWGQSLLASAYNAVRNAESVDNSIATLLFRASVPVLKVQDLADIVGDAESRAAFLERVNLMNYGMSNNNMAIIDNEETLESFEPGAITNLDGVLERYYILVSAATGIPVVKLVGESAKGLNATGEGDLNNYYDMIEDFQSTSVKPVLMSMFKRWIVPSFFDELLPAEFDIEFPPLERITADKKQEADNGFLNSITAAVDAGIIDKKVARREILNRGMFTSYSEEDIKRIETEEQDNDVDLTDALDVADKKFEQEMDNENETYQGQKSGCSL